MNVTSNYFHGDGQVPRGACLWANIVKAYGPRRECACKMFTHAVTSAWNQTVYDPYVNMLRGTTEAMSASIAGVHSLEVLPFDASYGEPDEFEAHRPQRRAAAQARVALRSGGRPRGRVRTTSRPSRSRSPQRPGSSSLEIEEKGGYTAAYEARPSSSSA